MSGLSLLLGLIVPWVAGTLVLHALGSGARDPGARLRNLGFGFFLGISLAVFGLRALEALTGEFLWWAVNAALAGLAAACGVIVARRPDGRSAAVPHHPATRGERWLAGLLLLAIVVHFLFSTIEILTQPVFPWDGWTVWVYRAKAWFHAGHLAPVVAVGPWLAAESAQVYTTPALGYPLLPTLVPLWTALGLGAWSETLVNLPVLACALAIALGLAGCLRRAGVGVLWTLGATYLLFSTPMFGVHMSLGGYADIWMAGFAGLGMTGLLCGLLTNRPPLTWLGMTFLVLGTVVKVEGMVWLTAGLAVLALGRLSLRHLAWVFATLVVLALAAGLSGHTVFDVPGLGSLGYRDGLLYLPVKGHITLAVTDVREAYFRNAFLLGSWHLLWALVAVTLVLLALRPRRPLTRIAFAFFFVFVGLQAFMFVFTAEGAWARDYTAINRMPLQMLPAILFLVVTTLAVHLQERLRRASRRAGLGRAIPLGLVGGTLLTVAGVVAWKASLQPTGEPARLAIGPGDLRYVVGGGREEGDAIVVERFQDGIALLSSGPVNLDPEPYSYLRVDIRFDQNIESLDQAPAFFWRRKDQPRDVSRKTLLRSGLLDLSGSEDWRGQIVEYGFFFVENHGEPITIRAASLEGPSLGNTLSLVPGQWTAFETWTQRSAHWLPGGAFDQVVPVTGFVLTMALLASVLAWLFLGRREGLPSLAIMLLAGWILLDLRWGWDRVRQADLSIAQLRHMSVAERLADGELGIFYDYVQRLLDERLGAEPQRVILVPDPTLHKYFGLRTKYQLLPHSVTVMRRLPAPRRLANVDYVLYLGRAYGDDPAPPAQRSPANRWSRFGLGDDTARQRLLEPVDSDVHGTLFRVTGSAGAKAAQGRE